METTIIAVILLVIAANLGATFLIPMQANGITVMLVRQVNCAEVRHRSQIRPQLHAASPTNMTNRPQPKFLITIVMINFKMWPAAGCVTKSFVTEISCCAQVCKM